MREARDRIHHQKHVFSEIAEEFGGGARELGGTKTQERRFVAGCNHDHAPGKPFRAERVLDEILDFSSSFTDERDDIHIRRGAPRDCAE